MTKRTTTQEPQSPWKTCHSCDATYYGDVCTRCQAEVAGYITREQRIAAVLAAAEAAARECEVLNGR
jgi:uncharacterized paraquat-inducible protein A